MQVEHAYPLLRLCAHYLLGEYKKIPAKNFQWKEILFSQSLTLEFFMLCCVDIIYGKFPYRYFDVYHF